MSTIKLVSDHFCFQNGAEFVKVTTQIFIFPTFWNLANKKSYIDCGSFFQTDSFKKLFFFQSLSSIFEFSDTFFIILGMF